MKIKLSLLAFLLGSSAFGAYSACFSKYYGNVYVKAGVPNNFILCNYNRAMDGAWECFPNDLIERFTKLGTASSCQVSITNYSMVYSCPAGQSGDSRGVCVPSCAAGGTYDYSKAKCMTPLNAYDNDSTACHSNGGLLWTDGECLSYTDFGKKILASPSSIIGSGFFINGLLFTSAGLVGAGLGGGLAASGFATVGAYAMLIGVGTALFGNADAFASNLSPSATNDVMKTPTDRVKVSVDQYQNTQVATADTSTGRVTEISTIPPEVKQRIIDGTVNPTTGQPNLAPSDFAGTRSTSYDYVAKVATTKTIQSDGTVKTQTAPILTQTNTTTGVVSTYSADTAVAPDVTGTTGSPTVDPNWSNYKTIASWTVSTADSATGTGTGTGTMTGTDTGGGISGGGATGAGVNPADGSAEELFAGVTLDDGSTRFEGLTDAVTSQYGGFVNNNPLDITCSSNVETYSFNLMGRNFILFDKALVDKLPVALIKGIFLFVAAISGLILTFSGGA